MNASKRIVFGEFHLLQKYSDVETEEFKGFGEGFHWAGAVLMNRLPTQQITNNKLLHNISKIIGI